MGTRPFEARQGTKPFSEFKSLVYRLRKMVRGFVSGWWFTLRNRHLESQYNGERLVEVTRQFRERFK